MKKLLGLILILTAFPCFSQKVMEVEEYAIADIKIYEVSQPIFADLCVFLTKNESIVHPKENNGIWMKVNGASANFKIKKTKNESAADLKVYYVSEPTQAGWKNPGKKRIIGELVKDVILCL